MPDSATTGGEARRPGILSRVHGGLITVVVATVLLLLVGAVFSPASVSRGAILGMLPYAAVLVVAGLGQTLVVQQGGIDLSVPGGISLTVVICTHLANGQDSRLPRAALTALAVVLVAGVINGFLITHRGLNPIIATLGMNALLYSVVLGLSGGIPRGTTRLLANIVTNKTFGIPNSVYFAVAAAVLVTVIVKKTVAGRRFEAVGANPIAAWAAGLRAKRHGMSAYVWAMVMYWLAGCVDRRDRRPAHRVSGGCLPALLGGGRRPGRDLPAGWEGLSDLYRNFGPVPDPTRPIRSDPRRLDGDPHAGRGRRPRRRRRPPHGQLGRIARAVRTAGKPRSWRRPRSGDVASPEVPRAEQ